MGVFPGPEWSDRGAPGKNGRPVPGPLSRRAGAWGGSRPRAAGWRVMPDGLQVGHIVLRDGFHILKPVAGSIEYLEVPFLVGDFGNVAVQNCFPVGGGDRGSNPPPFYRSR